MSRKITVIRLLILTNAKTKLQVILSIIAQQVSAVQHGSAGDYLLYREITRRENQMIHKHSGFEMSGFFIVPVGRAV